MKKSICVSLDEELLAELDRERGMVSRSKWVEHKLRDDEYDERRGV